MLATYFPSRFGNIISSQPGAAAGLCFLMYSDIRWWCASGRTNRLVSKFSPSSISSFATWDETTSMRQGLSKNSKTLSLRSLSPSNMSRFCSQMTEHSFLRLLDMPLIFVSTHLCPHHHILCAAESCLILRAIALAEVYLSRL